MLPSVGRSSGGNCLQNEKHAWNISERDQQIECDLIAIVIRTPSLHNPGTLYFSCRHTTAIRRR